MLAFFAIVFGIVFLDQLTKWLAVIFLKGSESFNLIKGVLRFTYLENPGAAFGMLANNRWIFLIVSTAMIIGITFYMFKFRPQNKWEYVSCSFIVGGGIGNMIDRLALGYVIDFIDFCAFPKIWKFVFNVADSFVCVGAGILMVYLVVSMIKETRAVGVSEDATEQKEPTSEALLKTEEENKDEVQQSE